MQFSKKWGPYLSDRQWGVVREDYSESGDAWNYTSHDQARSKAWRWGEDGIGGISDEDQFLCFAPAFWNGVDPILKERLFGLTNAQGNHGEDVKELYYYLDNTPDHRYMRMLYKYPHAAFPYQQLEAENSRRSRQDREYELLDTGIFDQNRYFDLFIEYAKGNSDTDLLIKITACNRGPDAADLSVLPTLWFRNLWSFGLMEHGRPTMEHAQDGLVLQHPALDNTYYFYAEGKPNWLFCENETNLQRLYGTPNTHPGCKDGINDYVVAGHQNGLNQEASGTKAAAWYQAEIAGGATAIFRFRLTTQPTETPFADFEGLFSTRKDETTQFYAEIQKEESDDDLRRIQQQAWAGMLWSKQFYHYHIPQWLYGDPGQPSPPPQRLHGRNHDWPHFKAAHVLSMPDKWEYPWFAAWDLAFHCVAFARIDPAFSKNQLRILHSELFRHDDGSIPSYEWNFNDVNPPVQAWAVWRVFEMERGQTHQAGDLTFLLDLFEPLRGAYRWWMSQKDIDGNDLFSGGFLGLDNIGVFDRSQPLPDGNQLEQADATAWAAFYALEMLRISLELAKDKENTAYYQEEACGFFHDFLRIAYAIGSPEDNRTLWDDNDGFFYDALRLPDGSDYSLKIRSVVGLIPMLAVLCLDDQELVELPLFKAKTDALLEENPELASMISRWHDMNGDKRLLSLLRGHRMKGLLRKMLDPNEFLSDFGVRSMSKYHLDHPFQMNWFGQDLSVSYLPAESDSGMFGGNSNWRGPIWMPVNFLLVESLRAFHQYYSDDFRVEFPIGSDETLSIQEVAQMLTRNLFRIFKADTQGARPLHGSELRYQNDPWFKDLLLFYEYFDGDNGRGVGASHQTGWTGLVSVLK